MQGSFIFVVAQLYERLPLTILCSLDPCCPRSGQPFFFPDCLGQPPALQHPGQACLSA